MRAQHPLGEHLSTCSGPDNCQEYAAVLAMTPTQHANYLNESTARFAQKRTARQFRASQQEDADPPDPFAADIAKRRQSEATPESTFAERYAAERTAANQAEYAEHETWRAAHPAPRVMTADELKQYAPVDPYRAGIQALQAKAQKEAK